MKTRLFLLFLSLLIAMPACADSEWWGDVNLRSKHINATQQYNENNFGLGLERVFDHENSVNLGFYRNSDDRTSKYLTYGYTPYEWLDGVRAGVMLGLVDGYPKANNGNTLLMAAFLVKMEWKRGGANLYLIPACQDCETPAVIGLQLRFRFR